MIEAVERLSDCGLLVKAVICDRATNNVAALKLLNVTKDKSLFEVNDRNINAFFDTPHFLKNLCNHFIKKNFIFDSE